MAGPSNSVRIHAQTNTNGDTEKGRNLNFKQRYAVGAARNIRETGNLAHHSGAPRSIVQLNALRPIE